MRHNYNFIIHITVLLLLVLSVVWQEGYTTYKLILLQQTRKIHFSGALMTDLEFLRKTETEIRYKHITMQVYAGCR